MAGQRSTRPPEAAPAGPPPAPPGATESFYRSPLESAAPPDQTAAPSPPPAAPPPAPPDQTAAPPRQEPNLATEDRRSAAGDPVDPYADPFEHETLEERIARILAIPGRTVGSFEQKLAYPTRAGYKRHWFNDSPGRVNEAKKNGWSHVLGNDRRPVTRNGGTGRDSQPMAIFLLEIPMVIYQMDMQSRHDFAAERLNQLKKTPFQSGPGAATATAADKGKFYDPGTLSSGPLEIKKGA